MFFRTDGAPSPVSTERQSRTRRPPSTLKVTCWIFVFGIFWKQKRAWSCIDIMCSSKYVDFYAFPFAMRPSGANANAQLILPGENFLKKNSDNF